jgi:hypothetical protein
MSLLYSGKRSLKASIVNYLFEHRQTKISINRKVWEVDIYNYMMPIYVCDPNS